MMMTITIRLIGSILELLLMLLNISGTMVVVVAVIFKAVHLASVFPKTSEKSDAIQNRMEMTGPYNKSVTGQQRMRSFWLTSVLIHYNIFRRWFSLRHNSSAPIKTCLTRASRTTLPLLSLNLHLFCTSKIYWYVKQRKPANCDLSLLSGLGVSLPE